jgi:hypothetical protein
VSTALATTAAHRRCAAFGHGRASGTDEIVWEFMTIFVVVSRSSARVRPRAKARMVSC